MTALPQHLLDLREVDFLDVEGVRDLETGCGIHGHRGCRTLALVQTGTQVHRLVSLLANDPRGATQLELAAS